MSGLNPDKKGQNMIIAIETFLNTLSTLYGLFDDYNGGEYC